MADESAITPFTLSSSNAIRQRRKCVPDRPQASISLWSIMRNCIGKELTKIPMPVRAHCNAVLCAHYVASL